MQAAQALLDLFDTHTGVVRDTVWCIGISTGGLMRTLSNDKELLTAMNK